MSGPLGFVERAAPALTDGWMVWGGILGQDVSVDGSRDAAGWDASTGGVTFGVERQFDAGVFPALAGLAFGYTQSSVNSEGSNADVDAFHIGAYAATRAGALSLSGAFAYAWQDYDFERVIPLPGTRVVIPEGDTIGRTLTGSVGAFYDLASYLGPELARPGLRIGPLATLDAVHGEQDGFTETGAGILDLTVSDTDGYQVVTGLGIGFGLDRAVAQRHVSLEGRVAWERVFGDRSITTSSAIPFANAVFSGSSASQSRDRLAIGFGAIIGLGETVSTELRYDGAFAASGNDHRASLSLSVAF
ncbi:MAG: autotransporter outer membrane beta-barrel domain-containing protein [Pseudomonadota bacterium]